jgi:hypothetical protein
MAQQFQSGRCNGHHVDLLTRPVNLELILTHQCCPMDLIPDVIAHMSLGQRSDYEGTDGLRRSVWYDPKAARVRFAHAYPTLLTQQTLDPIFCPHCSAVLTPWQPGQDQQACPICRCEVSSGE